MAPNPYDSPKQQSIETRNRQPRLTKRTTFWGGVAAICASVFIWICSDTLYALSRTASDGYNVIVNIMDVLVIVVFGAGCIAVIMSQWLSERPRTYSRRRH